MADGGQMVMAGLWVKWKSPMSGEEVLSCTILTCGPNKVMDELHDRSLSFSRRTIGQNGWVKNPANEQTYWRYSNPVRTRH
jgi:putative SOS response-associated peptidase YedK